MTISVAWIRKIGKVEELLFASDSRLRGYGAWDSCPKILPLRRGDSAISFSGSTDIAYPLFLQLANVVLLHKATASRELDLPHLQGHFCRVLQGMVERMSDWPSTDVIDELCETKFIFGGYIWKEAQYRIWKASFKKDLKRFKFDKARGLRIPEFANTVCVVANPAGEGIEAEFNFRLSKYGPNGHAGWDMEPFLVLRDLIREEKFEHVGGPPQLVKIYRSSNVKPLGVYWPDKKSKTASVLGRLLLSYEKFDCPLIDPDTLEIGMDV